MTAPRRLAKHNVAYFGGLLFSAACLVGGCSSEDGSPVTTTQPGDSSTADSLPDGTTDAQEGATCVPVTCSSAGAQCGEIVDKCGGKVDCGACSPPNNCGGGGTANQCGSSAVGACGNGAVSSQCTCGSSVVNSGFCCGGISRSTDCVRVRLDAGLAAGTSTLGGKVFSPLLPYLTAGQAYDSSEGIEGSYPIANTDHDALYQNETWVETASPATFTIPIDNGNYTVHLHFVDWAQSSAGERQFHVDLQGKRVLTDLDIISEAGKSTALVKSFDVAVTNDALNLTITDHVFYAEIAAVEIVPQGEAHLPTTGAAGNHPPTVNAGADQAILLPTTSVSVNAAATDPDGDPLSYAWTKTAGGAATIATPSAASTQITGLVAGAYTFTVTVDDGKGGIATDSVVVNVTTGAVVDPAWYVSPTGLDSNAGTSATAPFKTLEKARSAATASATTKTVYLLGGVHARTGPLYLGSGADGQTWLGYPGQTPILDGGSSTVRAIVLTANNITIRWITFRNFVNETLFIGNWGTTTGVVIDSNTIQNALCTGWSQAAIFLGGVVTGAQITHNLVDGSEYAGIQALAGSGNDLSGLTIAYNAVHDTCRSIADCGAIYVMDRAHASTDITIDHNVAGDYGTTSNQSKGIYLDDDQSNVTATNNIIYGTGQWPFQIHGGDHNVFTN